MPRSDLLISFTAPHAGAQNYLETPDKMYWPEMDDELRQNVAGNSNDVKTMLNGNSFQTRKLYKCT